MNHTFVIMVHGTSYLGEDTRTYHIDFTDDEERAKKEAMEYFENDTVSPYNGDYGKARRAVVLSR